MDSNEKQGTLVRVDFQDLHKPGARTHALPTSLHRPIVQHDLYHLLHKFYMLPKGVTGQCVCSCYDEKANRAHWSGGSRRYLGKRRLSIITTVLFHIQFFLLFFMYPP